MATKAHRETATEMFVALRAAGVPTWVTSGEAFRMTDGEIGTENDMSGANGFNLSTLTLTAAKSGVTVHPL